MFYRFCRAVPAGAQGRNTLMDAQAMFSGFIQYGPIGGAFIYLLWNFIQEKNRQTDESSKAQEKYLATMERMNTVVANNTTAMEESTKANKESAAAMQAMRLVMENCEQTKRVRA
jgi:hypothetical protein